MRRTSAIVTVLASTMSLCIGILLGNTVLRAGAARAQAPSKIAVVDMYRIYNASTAPDELDRRQIELEAQSEQSLQAIGATPFLNKAQLAEYAGLVTKEQPTQADQDRIKALKAISDASAEQLRQLQTKRDADLTPADKDTMTRLTAQSRTMDRLLPSFQQTLRADQQMRIDMFRHDQVAELRTLVAKIANKKGASDVFDAQALVYCPNDLTKDVIESLGK